VFDNIQETDPIPDPMASEAQRDRFENRDLSGLTSVDILHELTWLRLRNYWVDSSWHAERERHLGSELNRRKNLQRDRQVVS
jgi:hypothetical protein